MKKRLVAICLGALLMNGCGSTLKATAANQVVDDTSEHIQVIDLYAGDIPGEIKLPNQEVVRDPTHPDTFIMDVNQPQITVYQADPAIANGTAVIICPGGSYKGVSIVKEGYQVAERLNKLGVTAFVLKYRMPNDKTMLDKTTGPLQDVQQAIHMVREKSKQWGIKADQVGIMGFSAGGHLASTAATHFDHAVMPEYKNANLRPDFQVLVYPVISTKDGVTHMGSRENLLGKTPSAETLAHYSNETQITPQTPIAFIAHASDDRAVPVENALLYVEALAENKVQTELVLMPSGGHGFGMRNEFDWFESLAQWLKNNQLL